MTIEDDDEYINFVIKPENQLDDALTTTNNMTEILNNCHNLDSLVQNELEGLELLNPSLGAPASDSQAETLPENQTSNNPTTTINSNHVFHINSSSSEDEDENLTENAVNNTEISSNCEITHLVMLPKPPEILQPAQPENVQHTANQPQLHLQLQPQTQTNPAQPPVSNLQPQIWLDQASGDIYQVQPHGIDQIDFQNQMQNLVPQQMVQVIDNGGQRFYVNDQPRFLQLPVGGMYLIDSNSQQQIVVSDAMNTQMQSVSSTPKTETLPIEPNESIKTPILAPEKTPDMPNIDNWIKDWVKEEFLQDPSKNSESENVVKSHYDSGFEEKGHPDDEDLKMMLDESPSGLESPNHSYCSNLPTLVERPNAFLIKEEPPNLNLPNLPTLPSMSNPTPPPQPLPNPPANLSHPATATSIQTPPQQINHNVFNFNFGDNTTIHWSGTNSQGMPTFSTSSNSNNFNLQNLPKYYHSTSNDHKSKNSKPIKVKQEADSVGEGGSSHG